MATPTTSRRTCATTCARSHPTTDFFYRTIAVERPLRVDYALTDARIEKALASRPLQKWDADVRDSLAATLAAPSAVERAQQVEASRADFTTHLAARLTRADIPLTPAQLKALVTALGAPDDEGELLTAAGKPVTDATRRDTENVPWDDDIHEYLKREVKPFVPDAWIDSFLMPGSTKRRPRKGAEIPFRHPQGEPLLRAGRGALVHFALTQDEVAMTIRLAGDATSFLPFNRGHNRGAGNAPNGDKPRTAYFWEDVLDRDAWLQILTKFVYTNHEKQSDPLTGKVTTGRRSAFLASTSGAPSRRSPPPRTEGPGHRYLVQHSAGSGKTDSIAWTAHRLASLHTPAGDNVLRNYTTYDMAARIAKRGTDAGGDDNHDEMCARARARTSAWSSCTPRTSPRRCRRSSLTTARSSIASRRAEHPRRGRRPGLDLGA